MVAALRGVDFNLLVDTGKLDENPPPPSKRPSPMKQPTGTVRAAQTQQHPLRTPHRTRVVLCRHLTSGCRKAGATHPRARPPVPARHQSLHKACTATKVRTVTTARTMQRYNALWEVMLTHLSPPPSLLSLQLHVRPQVHDVQGWHCCQQGCFTGHDASTGGNGRETGA